MYGTPSRPKYSPELPLSADLLPRQKTDSPLALRAGGTPIVFFDERTAGKDITPWTL